MLATFVRKKGSHDLARAVYLRHIVFPDRRLSTVRSRRQVCAPSRLIDRGLAHYVGFMLAQDSSMKQYIVEFAHPSGPLSLIAASVRAASKSSAIRIVRDRLRKIVSEESLPIVTEYSVEIDEASASLFRAFRTVTDNDQEKLAVLISALEQYSPILATRIRGLLNRDADGSAG